LFAEDFEDGDYVGWLQGATPYSLLIVGEATIYSARQLMFTNKSTVTDGTFDGFYRTLPDLRPTAISWQMQSPAQLSGGAIPLIQLYANADRTERLLTLQIVQVTHGVGTMRLVTAQMCGPDITSGSSEISIELRNIDWTSRTFDYYAYGTKYGSGCVFHGTGTSVSRMEIGTSMPNAYAYVDEIVFW